MKSYKLAINGNTYNTQVLKVEGNVAEIDVNGTTYSVELDSQNQSNASASQPKAASAPIASAPKSQGSGTIKSPLPGTVLDILVQEGSEVKVGQKLILLEAMKMENNIEADKAGRVVSIKKKKGDSVMEGDVLMIIE